MWSKHRQSRDGPFGYSGSESAKDVRMIRAGHGHHLQRGLKMTLDRLGKCCGSPEVTGNSLFQGVDSLPRIF